MITHRRNGYAIDNMKKALLLATFLLLPFIAFATASSVDRITDHIQPLIKTDYVKAQYFTATSTTATSTLPILNASLRFLGAGLTSCSGANQAVTWNSATWQFGCVTISASGVTSLKQTFGSALTGALTMGTSTLTLNGQTIGTKITDDGSSVFTFTPTLSGVLSEAGGGTNQSTYAKGDVLYASAANTLSKLGISTGGFVLSVQNGIPTWVATSSINNGVSSVIIPGNTLIGAITLATSSTPFNGLTSSTTITNSANTLTFTNTLAGLLGIGGGGTNATSFGTSDGIVAYNGTKLITYSGYTQTSVLTTLTNASTTNLSGAYASSTIGNIGFLTLPNITGTQCLHVTGSGLVSGTGSDCGSGSGGVSSLKQTYGSALTGTLTLATSSSNASFNGLTASTTITDNGSNTFTFNDSLSGLLGPIGGGTGLAAYTTGDILYGSNTNVLSRLPIGTGGFVLAVSGGVPAWVATSSINNGLTSIGPTGQLQVGPAVTLATSSTAFNGLTASTTITASGNTITYTNTLAGTLGSGGGGTGFSTYATGDTLYASGTNTLSKLSAGTGGFVLSMQNGVPTWVATSSINNGVITIGPTGQTITANVNLATSSVAFNGLTASTTITCSTPTCTFANTLAGKLNPGGGGTGLTTYTTGDLIYASNTNVLTQRGIGTGGFILASSGGLPTWVATTTFSSGLLYSAGNVTNTGVLSVSAGGGSAITGALILATSSTPFNGLTSSTTIICATQTCTFANTMAGLLGVAGGGTNASSFGTTNGIVAYNGTSLVNYAGYIQTSVLTTLTNASTTAFSSIYASSTIANFGSLTLPNLISKSCLGTDGSGVVITGTCSGGSGQNPNSKWATSTLDAFAIYPNSAIHVGIGTTTPQWALTIASSTGPQLGLTDGSLTSPQWTFRNAGGNLYVGATTASTFATSTIAPLTLLSGGNIGVGSTTPWARVSIAFTNMTATDYLNPLFSAATSSDLFGQLVSIFATSSTLIARSTQGADSGSRLMVGVNSHYTLPGNGGLDQVEIDGRINTDEWASADCEAGTGLLNIASDTNNFCGGWTFEEDTDGNITPQGGTAQYVSWFINTTSTNVNDGAGVFFGGAGSTLGMSAATNTPVIETTLRLTDPRSASSTAVYVGFTNVNPTGSSFEVAPTSGCYFTASSTRLNWAAVCGSAGTFTVVDTGVASTTGLGGAGAASNGSFNLFRVEMDNTKANFYIQTPTASMKKFVITTNYPATVGVVGGIYYGKLTVAPQSPGVEFINAKGWWRQPFNLF